MDYKKELNEKEAEKEHELTRMRSRLILIGTVLCLLCFVIGFTAGGGLKYFDPLSIGMGKTKVSAPLLEAGPAGPALIAERAETAIEAWLNGSRTCLRCFSSGYAQGKSFEPSVEYPSMTDYLEMLSSQPGDGSRNAVSAEEKEELLRYALSKEKKSQRLCFTVGFVIGNGIEMLSGNATAKADTEQFPVKPEGKDAVLLSAKKTASPSRELPPKEESAKKAAAEKLVEIEERPSAELSKQLAAEAEPAEERRKESAEVLKETPEEVPRETTEEVPKETPAETGDIYAGEYAEIDFEGVTGKSAAVEWDIYLDVQQPTETQEETPANTPAEICGIIQSTDPQPMEDAASEDLTEESNRKAPAPLQNTQNGENTEQPERAAQEQEPTAHDKLLQIGLYKITAYCPCEICCGLYALNRPNGVVYGASGEVLQPWYSAASPLPFGTRLYIPDLGEFVVQDRTADWVAEANGNKIIDLYMQDHEEAEAFGVRNVIVYIITE